MDLTINQVWTKYWKDVAMYEYDINNINQATGWIPSHCGFVFLPFFFVHRHLEEKQSSPRKQKAKQLLTMQLVFPWLMYFFLRCIATSVCRWQTHGNFFPTALSCAGFEFFNEKQVHTFSFTFIVMKTQPVVSGNCKLNRKSGCRFEHKSS